MEVPGPQSIGQRGRAGGGRPGCTGRRTARAPIRTAIMSRFSTRVAPLPHTMDAVVLAASIAEAMGALLVAAVAAGCLHAYPRPHLKPWAWSWLAGAAAVALTVFASSALPLSHPTGPAAGIANLALRCVQIASFMIGA